jgi:hypothetical protein
MTSRKLQIPGVGPMIETTDPPPAGTSQDIALDWDTPDGQPPKMKSLPPRAVAIWFFIGVTVGVVGTVAYVQA